MVLCASFDARREGNLYYLREVVLPAGRYILEATVQDLIAGKSGGVREPLRTGIGTPGFTASDALLVRPFNGAADVSSFPKPIRYCNTTAMPSPRCSIPCIMPMSHSTCRFTSSFTPIFMASSRR